MDVAGFPDRLCISLEYPSLVWSCNHSGQWPHSQPLDISIFNVHVIFIVLQIAFVKIYLFDKSFKSNLRGRGFPNDED